MRGVNPKATCALVSKSWALLIAVTLVPPSALAETWPGVHIGDTFTANAVRRALDGAARRLRAPRCAEVFSSPILFDQEGRPLLEKLTQLQTDGPTYLARLTYYEASSSRTCQRNDTLAFTTVGAGHVFVCGPRFLAAWRQSPYLVELTMIHEVLHTLGLGENPPSSRAISNVVRDYCDHVPRMARD
jgi:hypothetical protein